MGSGEMNTGNQAKAHRTSPPLFLTITAYTTQTKFVFYQKAIIMLLSLSTSNRKTQSVLHKKSTCSVLRTDWCLRQFSE